MPNIQMRDFLSDHTSPEQVIEIQVEPEVVYIEDGRDAQYLNFDFVLTGLTDRDLELRFIKVAVYGGDDALLTYRYLNHNGVGIPGIHTLGNYRVAGREQFDLFNPFYQFPRTMALGRLRYMFTFADTETRQEYYYGNVVVTPSAYHQEASLHLPLRGVITVLDGHDYCSHHRRFAMSLVRDVTHQQFTSNFSRYAVDLVLIGEDGNLRDMTAANQEDNYDFHFTDVRRFHTHNAEVLAPGHGVVVDVMSALDDLTTTPFNLDAAIQAGRIATLAGNYVIIQHNADEYSHLFHLLKGSIEVSVGQHVTQGQTVGRVGFSGAATTYSHLHYQLMDGPNFLRDGALPCKFSDVTLLINGQPQHFPEVALDTGDFILNTYETCE